MRPKSSLKDDETRLARFDQMTPAEQQEVVNTKNTKLAEAESQRKRPFTSRVMDKLVTAGAPFRAKRDADASSRSIQEDEKLREDRYQSAKKEAASRSGLYGVERVLKLDGKPVPMKDYAKGGMVKSSASKRADGCAQRGKTRA